mmetsp:Transcript_313/g.352  ORF Transcript_313/g.352 Transcript_313/m.352 type:complete len:98 (-) Transcript_313:211-504(-)
MLKFWKWQQHASCPRCEKCLIETTTHVLQCTAPSAQLTWDTKMNGLKKWLIANHTVPDITTIIMNRMNDWRNQSIQTSILSNYPGVDRILLHQDLIG